MIAQPKTETAETAGTPKATARPPAPAPRPSGAPAITPAQRAAVIITLLGEGAAKPIVDKLDDRALAKVGDALETISVLPRAALIEIVIDFLTHLRGNDGALRGGPSKAREILAGLIGSERLNSVLGESSGEKTGASPGEAGSGETVWTRFATRDPNAIAEYLGRLTPNIIAMALRRLDVTVASDVLARIDEAKLAPVMGCMVDTRPPDPGLDSVVARMIEMEFLNTAQDSAEADESHLEALGELLSLIPDQKRDSLVEFLEREHDEKLRRIEQALLTIEGLPDTLPRSAVPVLFRELDRAMLIKLLGSLQASQPDVADYLLGNISSRMADQFRDELEGFEPLPADELETLRRDFLTSVLGMRQQGLITLERREREAE